MTAAPAPMACPSDEVLGALVHRALDSDETARVRSHVDDCPLCQRVVIAAVRGGVAPGVAATSATAATIRVGERPADPVGPTDPMLPTASTGQAAPRIGRYELRGLLGIGGMGAVYEAHDIELDRPVALKLLRPELGESPGFIDRFIRESRLTAKVAHPSVITVHDVGEDGGTVFIAMELIRGSTLSTWLSGQSANWRTIVSVFERAGQGLAAAHAVGIVHRDFKPDNVLVTHDAQRVVVTDFGLAHDGAARSRDDLAISSARGVHRGHPRITTDGALLGTPAYMAPEQLSGREGDRRADVFAFSVSLWEALFHSPPFPGASVGEIYGAMQSPPRPAAGAPRVPRRLLRALRTGLALDPAARWPDMPALIAELTAIRMRPRRAVLAAAAAGLVGMGLLAALALTRPESSVDRCERGLASLATAYNPRLAVRVGASLAQAPGVADQVGRKLRGAADAWRATEGATCHADHQVAQDARTTACLDARLLELGGAVDDAISGGPSDALAAIAVVGDPAACANPAPGLLFARVPADRALGRKVTALRAQFAEADAAFERFDYAKAIELGAAALAASVGGWPPVHAEALYELGKFQRSGSDIKLAIATLLEAAGAAERAHDDAVAADTWIQLIQAAAFDKADPLRAIEYAASAEAAADRIGRPPYTIMRLEYAKGLALLGARRRGEAETALRETLAIAEHTGARAMGFALQALGSLYHEEGRYRDAVAMYRRSLEHEQRAPNGEIIDQPLGHALLALNLAQIGELSEAEIEAWLAVGRADRVLPESHHQRPVVHLYLSLVLREAGRNREALDEVDKAVGMFARTQGERSVQYGSALEQYGEILVSLGRPAEAEPLIARACDILAFGVSEDSAEVALCEEVHGAALVGVRRDGDALTQLDRALPALVTAYGERHPEVAHGLVARGAAHASRGEHDAAVSDFRAAVAILTDQQLEPGYLASARWQLGRELWRDDPSAGRAEVAAAAALFATANPRWIEDRKAASAWLAHHEPAADR